MDEKKEKRKRILRIVIGILVLSVFFIVVVLARGLLLPVFVAFVLAYIFKPLIYTARLKGIPKTVSVTVIAAALISFGIITVRMVDKILPRGLDRVEKQVLIQYQLNQKLIKFFELAEGKAEGSFAYKYFHNEIDKMMSSINGLLRLTEIEVESLELVLTSRNDERSKKTLNMLMINKDQAFWKPDHNVEARFESGLPQISFSQLATWFIFPIVFFFLLVDDGSVNRFFINAVPNSYFELTLTVFERVDKALGHYLRGTALECAAVGSVIVFILLIFGVDVSGAIAIGLVAGLFNAIPFLGTIVGLVFGGVYVMMIETATPWIPFLTHDHLVLGVCVAVGVAHLLDNAVFQPLLVGRAVNLHPLAVIITVAVSGMAFGFMGMLIAIPTVVTVKVCLETIFSGLRDYKLM